MKKPSHTLTQFYAYVSAWVDLLSKTRLTDGLWSEQVKLDKELKVMYSSSKDLMDAYKLLLSYPNILTEILKKKGSNLYYMPPSIKDDWNFVKIACDQNPISIQHASKRIQKLKEVADWSVTTNPIVLHFMDKSFIHDEKYQIEALKHSTNYLKQLLKLKGVSNNKNIFKQLISQNPKLLSKGNEAIRRDPELVCEAIEREGAVQYTGTTWERVTTSPEIFRTVVRVDLPWLWRERGFISPDTSLAKNLEEKLKVFLEHVKELSKSLTDDDIIQGFRNRNLSFDEDLDLYETLLTHKKAFFIKRLIDNFKENGGHVSGEELLKRILLKKQTLELEVVTDKSKQRTSSKRKLGF